MKFSILNQRLNRINWGDVWARTESGSLFPFEARLTITKPAVANYQWGGQGKTKQKPESGYQIQN